MTPATRSQKRQRQESMPTTVNKHCSLYFPNGDVVLLSLPDASNAVTAFKVDRVFLLRASPIFEGMFALPPSQDMEIYDSVPLVRLQDESEHLEKFLSSLYDSRYIPWKKFDHKTLRNVEGILLLATKYQVDHLRERIISTLEQDWPLTLENWDMNEGEIRSRSRFDDGLLPEPCGVIRLARKCHVPSILPAAFYHLSRIRGTADNGLFDSWHEVAAELLEGERTAEFSLLDAEDFRCLIVGRDALLTIFKVYLEEAIRAIQGQCRSAVSGCAQSLKRVGDKLEVECTHDPLFWMTCSSWPNNEICQPCQVKIHAMLSRRREDIWKELPTLFLLDGKKSRV